MSKLRRSFAEGFTYTLGAITAGTVTVLGVGALARRYEDRLDKAIAKRRARRG